MLGLNTHFQIGGAPAVIALLTGRTLSVPHPSLRHPIALRAGSSDMAVFRDVVLHNAYDVTLDRPRLIVDAGANVGVSAALFASRWPDAQILALEPAPENLSLLQTNTQGYQSIRVIPAALWTHDGTIRLCDPGEGDWSYHVHPTDGQAVRCVSLPTLINQYGPIDFLKLDIEGAEDALLRDPSWLEAVRVIAVELHEHLAPGCTARLHDLCAHRTIRTHRDITIIGH